MSSAEHYDGADDVEALFVAGDVEVAFHRRRLQFDLARTVFSSANVDAGSMFLLRHLQSLPLAGAERVLDLGCGHGTLGLMLQALDDDRRVVSVDRDALALRFTRRNLERNELSSDSHTILGSLGLDAVGPAAGVGDVAGPMADPFDLIVSNIPGKAGESVIAGMLRDALRVAHQGTVLGVVVVKPLGPYVTSVIHGLGLEVLLAKGNKQYEVVVAIPPEGHSPGSEPMAGFEQGDYDRTTTTFRSGSLSWQATTVTGLDEFDSLAHPTKLLRSALQGVPAGPSIVVEPGQGHRALITARSGYPPAAVVSRDLLALRATERLLIDAGHDRPATIHDVTFETAAEAVGGGVPIVVMHAADKVHGPWFVDQVTRVLSYLKSAEFDRPADLVLTGRAGLLGRIEADVLRRHKGHLAHKRSERGARSIRFRISGRTR